MQVTSNHSIKSIISHAALFKMTDESTGWVSLLEMKTDYQKVKVSRKLPGNDCSAFIPENRSSFRGALENYTSTPDIMTFRTIKRYETVQLLIKQRAHGYSTMVNVRLRRKPAPLTLMGCFFIINLGKVTNQRVSCSTGATNSSLWPLMALERVCVNNNA